jgi:hypothetical protein
VYGATEAEYLSNLRKLLARFREAGVRLSPAKCRFGLREVEYVGHLINASGMNFSDSKKLKVLNFPKPVTQKQLKGFLGLGNYFRDHVRNNYSSEVAPLNQLVTQYKAGKVVVWTDTAEASFERTKLLLANCQSLFWADESLPVFLHTDASDFGVGAYLFQVDGEKRERPIRFLSQTFSPVQRRWSTIEKECYAIFFALRDLEYLIRDRKFTLRTDHRNLLFLNAQASAKVTRWKLAIQEYDFDIEHIPGVENVVADHMSRLCDGSRDSETALKGSTIALCLAELHDVEVTTACQCHAIGQSARLPRRTTQVPSVSIGKFKVISECHNTIVGHGGIDRTISLVHEYLSSTGKKGWPDEASMRRDIEAFVKNCDVCQKQSQVRPDVLTAPFDLSSDKMMKSISIDTMGPFPVDQDGNMYIIVVVDNFSRYAELFPEADCTAVSAARAVLQHISVFGCPSEILSDNGTQFVNQVMDAMASMFSIRLRRSTPYSHEENGIVERANKEVLRHLRAIMFERTIKADWSFCTPLVQRIMNATTHSTHGFAPAAIVTPGINLNEGILYPLKKGKDIPEYTSEFIQKLNEHQSHVIRLVTQRLASRKAIRMAKATSASRPVTEYLPGTFVLVAYPKGTRAPTKLHMPWMGPMQVVANTNSEYILRNLVTGKTMSRHVSTLKAFIPARRPPLDVARRDAEVHLVEKVISHEGDTRRKEQMKFRVRWIGFGPDDDTKEPWVNLKHNWVLHEYLRRAGLASLIPTEYRDVVAQGYIGLQGVV